MADDPKHPRRDPGSKGQTEPAREKHVVQPASQMDKDKDEARLQREYFIKWEARLNAKEEWLSEQELQAKNNFPSLFAERFAAVLAQLKQREDRCADEWRAIETEKDILRERGNALIKAEAERDAGYAAAREKLENELAARRASRLAAIEAEMKAARAAQMAGLEKELAEKKGRHEAELQKNRADLKENENALAKEKDEFESQKAGLENKARRLKAWDDVLAEREKGIPGLVEYQLRERTKSFEAEEARLSGECERLRGDLQTSRDLFDSFEDLQCKLGGEEPAKILLCLRAYEESNRKLLADLTTRPTREMQAAFDRMEEENKKLHADLEARSQECAWLKSEWREQSEWKRQIEEISAENESRARQLITIKADNDYLNGKLERLLAPDQRDKDREKRSAIIESPVIKDAPSRRADDDVDELQWLEGISESCRNYGLKFHPRILRAFHTALKTSEWSPITVLAGVSGTGKSELPRFYAHFGGINFLSLSVQPNWDSQESMLGFFNSMDNEFDAQPVLQLLAQSQKDQTEDYPHGLKDVMALVLMDEMNLAHVELYFAEFLSKLESRRGLDDEEVPKLLVKRGAGIDPYKLNLGRNVLWVGTMNQDETTKTLSDKVLDRGTVINFPRPTTLARRIKLEPPPAKAPLLSRKTWESWCRRESPFDHAQISPFKVFIEKMNASLFTVGRALGHRVWQSIEYYMANYPGVLAALKNNKADLLAEEMKVAFEDQLVQKVMPKMNGLETKGQDNSKCIDEIRGLLMERGYNKLIDDFNLACKFGYNQFFWYSATYLGDDEPVDEVPAAPENP